MAMQLQPETEISSDRSGSAVYVGNWDDAMALVYLFHVNADAMNFNYIAFAPPVLLDATAVGTASTTPLSTTDWSAIGAAIKSAGTMLVTGAQVRAMAGGLAQLTITFGNPDNIQSEIKGAIKSNATGTRGYTFGCNEIPHSILDVETTDVQSHISSWLTAPTALKSRFLYVNPTTEENAQLTAPEQIIAGKLLLGDDTYYTYEPTVTLSISNALVAPTGLPMVGPGASAPTGATINVTGTYTWRVVSSGSAPNSDGTHSGGATWVGTKVEEE